MKTANPLLAVQEIPTGTPLFQLRRLREGDETSLAQHADNRKISRYLQDRFPFPYTEQDALEFITYTQQSERESVFTIVVDGEAAGAVGLIVEEDVYRCSAELGYWLGEEHWGKGIMPRAVEKVVVHAFEALGLHRVYARVYANNKPSQRVMQKVGFEQEAILRKAAIKEGKIQDVYLYAMIR